MSDPRYVELQIKQLLLQTKSILNEGIIFHEEGRTSTLQGPGDALRFLLGKGASHLKDLEAGTEMRYFIWNSEGQFDQTSFEVWSDELQWDPNWVNNRCSARWDGDIYLWDVMFGNVLGDLLDEFNRLRLSIKQPLVAAA